jgi:hypothetical protein
MFDPIVNGVSSILSELQVDGWEGDGDGYGMAVTWNA